MLKSLVTAIIAVASLALLLTACGGKEKPVAMPADAQTGDLFLEPCTYEANKVEYEADCGTLVVPENRSNPGSRLIALPVVRLRSSGPNPTEPIFWLGGGPGNSNLGFNYRPSLYRQTGQFDPALLARLARPERFPKWMVPVFKLLLKTKIANMFWDNQFKANGAYERRFARPYAQ